jgi:hypothetical protein
MINQSGSKKYLRQHLAKKAKVKRRNRCPMVIKCQAYYPPSKKRKKKMKTIQTIAIALTKAELLKARIAAQAMVQTLRQLFSGLPMTNVYSNQHGRRVSVVFV